MTPYGKVAQAAIAAMSLLAEQDGTQGVARMNSREIAKRRRLSQAIVGKVLTTMSQVGLVQGAPGPGGGYVLARPPQEITLQDVVTPFDRVEDALVCPFGHDWCGTGPQCPLHGQLDALRHQWSTFLGETTLACFAVTASPSKRRSGSPSKRRSGSPSKRRSGSPSKRRSD